MEIPSTLAEHGDGRPDENDKKIDARKMQRYISVINLSVSGGFACRFMSGRMSRLTERLMTERCKCNLRKSNWATTIWRRMTERLMPEKAAIYFCH
jgi:hypothetical protein